MTKFQEFCVVAAGGALGGVISVAGAWAEPSTWPLSLMKFSILFIEPFLKGALAGGVGVYVLTSLDPNHMARAFFFASACGLSFPSVLAKGGSVVEHAISQVAQQSISENAKTIAESVPDDATPEKIDVSKIAQASTKIIEAEGKVLASDQPEVEAAVQQAVSVLGKKANTGDANAVQAISDIATLTAARKLDKISGFAIKELKILKENKKISEYALGRITATVEKIGG